VEDAVVVVVGHGTEGKGRGQPEMGLLEP
jgi:hypothetical protein